MARPRQQAEPFELYHPATGCMKCPALVRDRHTVVWGAGPEHSDIAIIGEAPGFNEDQQGLPFVGASGREAGKMLWEASGGTVGWIDVAKRNRLMCRPPGNRDPEPQEMMNCEPWLWENLRMVNPKIIICLGKYSQSLFFGGYDDLRQVHEVEGLMYRQVCFRCGGMDAQHQNRLATGGEWVDQGTIRCATTPRVLIAAIYHPAAAMRRADLRPRIVEQLRRAIDELHVMQRGG